MKKGLLVIRLIPLIIISIFLTSCGINTNNNTNVTPSAEIITPKPKVTAAEPLDIKDFTVADGTNILTLDAPYKDFKIEKEEKKIDNNYVGETTSGDVMYKNYMHLFEDLDIYVSNAYYDTKGRNFDEYYITQITLNTPVYKTARGISIGAGVDEVINQYGEGKKTENGGNIEIAYCLNDMELSFVIDEEQAVQSITLSVVVK